MSHDPYPLMDSTGSSIQTTFLAHLLRQTSVVYSPLSLSPLLHAQPILPFISIQLLHRRRLFSTFVSTAVPTSSSSFIWEENGDPNRSPKYSARPNSLYSSYIECVQFTSMQLIAGSTVGGMFLFPG